MVKNFLKIISLLFLARIIEASMGEYGILSVESSMEKENFCIIYFKEFVPLPEEKSKAEFYPVENATSINFCDDSISPRYEDFKNKILLLSRQNCSISEQASNVLEQGGKGILFITSNGRGAPVKINATLASHLNISVGLISKTSFEKLQKMVYPVTGCLYAPRNSSFDFSLLVIWVIAVFNITVGSYWSGHIRFAIYCKEMSLLPGRTEEVLNKPKVKANSNEESSMNLSPFYVACLVLCMAGMLLLLYFFFDYLVYFIIGLFVLTSIISLYSCFEPLILRIPVSCCKIFVVQLRDTTYNIDFRKLSLLVVSFAVSIWWLVIRKQKYAWILQNVLGVAFCIHMLKSVRLPSLKICTYLLVLLFFYDIFFVFVTPFLTMKGESVMEEVATGGKSDENMPMILKVAHFGFDALSICYEQFSILGFGDILVPGLLISYCYGFDLIMNKKIIYFPITIAAYGIGLLVTFGALFLMNTGQPALLYLVPCTLIPPVIVGWYRGELNLLWRGFKVIRPTKALKNPEIEAANNPDTTVVGDERPELV